MSLDTREWIDKAEGDFASATALLKVRSRGVNDGICFHAQQCAEKYLKALLCKAGRPFQKVHDLPKLLGDAVVIEPALHVLAPAADLLDNYAVRYRYPGAWATRPDARAALNHSELIREAIRRLLGLTTPKRKRITRRATKAKKRARTTRLPSRKRKKS